MKEKDIHIHMNQLKAIFLHNQNWEKFKKKHKRKLRSVVIKEVEKFLHCGDLSNGFRVFKCEACKNVKKYPIRCKGKFFPTCAVGEAQKWAEVQPLLQAAYTNNAEGFYIHAPKRTSKKHWATLGVI